jgi:hypothetical protein
MASSARLEANLTAADDMRRRLLEALLSEALASGDDRELVTTYLFPATGPTPVRPKWITSPTPL